MRTILSVLYFVVLTGLPLDAANFTKSTPSCTLGMEQVIPALLRDAAREAGVCPENVVVFSEAAPLFRAMGIHKPEVLATLVANRRAFVLGHKLPIYLKSDAELKKMFSLYQQGKEKTFLLAFTASWLKHELVHVTGVDDEVEATAVEMQMVESLGIKKNDPDYRRLQKRYENLVKAVKSGESHLIAVTFAPSAPRPPVVEEPMPETAIRPATLVAAR